ncbi:MAG: Tm-1-like ATP-binding domain-containing protein [Planctomycetes bacterium]|nr:Tm-1-like ATP-binding domain-containing protein [Planctomycetota bacterium]
MSHVIAVLATLDTKGAEAQFLRERIEALGSRALLIDLGVVGAPAARPDVTRAELAQAGGSDLERLLAAPTRASASPVLVAGAAKILLDLQRAGRVHAALGLGGTQGTSNCCAILQTLPYGFPKLMVSTVASGDTSAFVGIKDITMMFSVGDLLGLNPVTRRILSNAAGAAHGMALAGGGFELERGARPTVGISNLGVLTAGTMLAIELLRERGYESIVFHAVGSGGRAMEQMMKEGLIGAVLDYAMGEIADEVFHGLRAGGPERLTVAGDLGLPQVVVPGGAEHIGLVVEPNTVPERWKSHPHVFHNPIIFAPRLSAEELESVGREAARRLSHARRAARLLLPLRGVSRYSVPGGPLHDPHGDRAFFAALKQGLPPSVEVQEIDAGAEDPVFVRAMVDALVELVEARAARSA